jgi:hypothetical protein
MPYFDVCDLIAGRVIFLEPVPSVTGRSDRKMHGKNTGIWLRGNGKKITIKYLNHLAKK